MVRGKRRARMVVFMNAARLIGIVVVLGGLLAGLVYSRIQPEPFRVSGFIEADEIRLGSRVGGRVAQVSAAEGQRVEAGDVLLQLEPFDLNERRAQAESELRRRQAALEKLTAGFRKQEIAMAQAAVQRVQAQLDKLIAGPRPQEVATAKAERELAIAELERAQLHYERLESLLGKGAANREEFEEAQRQLKVAQARAQVAREQLGLLQEGSRTEDIAAARATLSEAKEALALKVAGYRTEDVAEARAAVDAAAAGLAAIDRQLAELTILSTVSGTVEAIDLQPGELVTPNAPAVSLLDGEHLWVRAYVPEDRLGIRLDQEVRVTVDSYPGQSFSGRISFVARQAEFTPGNVQTPEERSRQVFRIKVTLTSGLELLRPGMAADVWVDNQ